MRIAVGLDLDPEAARTYRLNFPEAVFIERNIREVTPAEVVAALGDEAAPLLVSACAPCQPYSSFGRGSKRDPRRTLLLRLLPFIDALEPEFVLVENVPGLNSKNLPARAGTFARFCKALRSSGFDLVSGVIDCRAYGVPQRRRRLVLMASRLGPISLPPPTHGSGDGLLPVSTVWEWIGDLPPIAAGEKHGTVPNHIASALTDINLRRIAATPSGGSRTEWPPELWLACHATHEGHPDVYGRMRADAPAPVLTTKCTSISNGRFGHPFQNRPISVREAACLQTFPRDFVFDGGIKSTTRQVGNAVPVLLSQRIGDAFMKHLVERSVDDPRNAKLERSKGV
ncbi:MAG TPA: DNA cytosine methyltransferase [Actinomycetota bacterium]|nr:DNA cytosine methyltransferase [Actinomycetota bacterium]